MEDLGCHLYYMIIKTIYKKLWVINSVRCPNPSCIAAVGTPSVLFGLAHRNRNKELVNSGLRKKQKTDCVAEQREWLDYVKLVNRIKVIQNLRFSLLIFQPVYRFLYNVLIISNNIRVYRNPV